MAINFFNSLAVGTDVLYVDALNDRVGIGTSSPADPFHLAMTNGDIRIDAETDRNHILSRNAGNTSWRDICISAISGQNQLALNTSGNVGIGVSNPSEKLDVNGNIKMSNGSKLYTNGGIIIAADDDGSGAGNILFKTVGTERMRITSVGRLGLGTSSPAKDLVINNSSGAQLQLQTSGTDKIRMEADSGGGSFYAPSGSYIRYFTSGSERMRIASGGNIGIGTASPGAKLDINNDVHIDTYSAGTTVAHAAGYIKILSDGKTGWAAGDELGKIEFYSTDASGIGARNAASIRAVNNQGNGSTTTTFSGELAFYTSAYNQTESERMRLTDIGRLGIGYTDPDYELQVNGEIGLDSYIRHNGDSNTFMGFSANDTIKFRTAGSDRLIVFPDGSIDVYNDFIIDNSSPELYFETGPTHYRWMVAAQENVDAALEITPSTTTGGSTYSTPVAVFKATGEVGIGTTNPTARLHVSGTSTGAAIDWSNTTATTGRNFRWVSLNSGGFAIEDLTAGGANRLTVGSTGNVGIGTSSPINGGGNAKWITIDGVSGSTYSGGVIYSIGGTSKAYHYVQDDYLIHQGQLNVGHKFMTNGTTELMRINSNGNVSVGTTNAYARFSVKATSHNNGISVNRQADTTAALYIGNDGGNNPILAANNADMLFGRDLSGTFTERMRLTNSGNVGIGTTSPSQKLEVNGTAKADEFVSLVNTSNSGITRDWTIIGTGDRGAALEVNDISGAKYAIYAGGYDLTFGKHVSSNNTYATAMGIYAANATDSSPYVQATHSFRAPIFYDSNNTSYYVNPASTSVLNDLDLKNNGILKLYRAGGNALQRADARVENGTTARLHWYGSNDSGGNTAFQHAWYDGADYVNVTAQSDFVYFDRVSGTVSVQSDGSFRAPIFYDSNNTSYYIDPASTSVANTINVDRINMKDMGDYITFYGNDNVDHSITSRDQNGNASDDIRINSYHSVFFDLDSNGNNSAASTGIFVGQHGSGNGTISNQWTFQSTTDGITQASGSFRAPIFYDSNDTTYYVNPAGNDSALFKGILNFNTTAGNRRGYIQATDTNDAHLIIATSGGEDISFRDGGVSGDWNVIIRGNGTTLFRTDAQSPIYYDRNNTGYYVDPDSRSLLNNLDANHFGINNTSSTTKDGISLYGGYAAGEPTYGLMFTGTSGSGTHGAVTSDWATYFTMNNNTNRGWIFRRVGSGNAASISAGGIGTFSGVRVGGTGTANELDDYEEGTWTLSFGYANTGSVTAYSVSSFGGYNWTGRYVKIGRLVHCTFYFSCTSFPWSVNTSSQVFMLESSFPFALDSTTQAVNGTYFNFPGFSSSGTSSAEVTGAMFPQTYASQRGVGFVADRGFYSDFTGPDTDAFNVGPGPIFYIRGSFQYYTAS